MFRDFLATTDVAIVSVGEVAAQQRERKAVATELVTGLSQFGLIAFNAQYPEQVCAGIAG